MKPLLTGSEKRPKAAGAEAAVSLQEELVAAIHGAFEVAVEIAVREVTKLVGQATGDVCEDMRRENESLKQRLQRAEALLDSAGREQRGGGSHTKQLLNATKNPPPHMNCSQRSPDHKVGSVRSYTGVRGHSRAQQLPDPQHDPEEQRSAAGEPQQPGGEAAAETGGGDGGDVLTAEANKEVSSVPLRVEGINQPCGELAADHNSPPLPTEDDESTLKQVMVKQERTEEEGDDSACCLDSIKVEDFSPECMSAVQSTILDEWKPEVLDQEFPNIFPLAEPAPIPEAPAQVYGVHVRTNRNPSHTFTNLHTCKSCGQTFLLPSLLRRHYGQCQQRLQQLYKQPGDRGKRTRLQLYPPGCSPFRCTECNREFNRLENLKTHLRIHTGERPYTCTVCSKCFRHSGALTRHFRIHTGEKPYVCGQCGKSFRNCGGLKFHQRSHSKHLQ